MYALSLRKALSCIRQQHARSLDSSDSRAESLGGSSDCIEAPGVGPTDGEEVVVPAEGTRSNGFEPGEGTRFKSAMGTWSCFLCSSPTASSWSEISGAPSSPFSALRRASDSSPLIIWRNSSKSIEPEPSVSYCDTTVMSCLGLRVMPRILSASPNS